MPRMLGVNGKFEAPNLANEQIDDVLVKRLLPVRDKWGGCQWECICKCGQPIILSSSYLMSHVLTKCTHNRRTLADVETPGKYVCAKNSGYSLATLVIWKQDGLLTEGESEVGEPDCFRETVNVPCEQGGTTPACILFYSIAALARCKKDIDARRKKLIEKNLADSEMHFHRGKWYARTRYVRRLFGSGVAGSDDEYMAEGTFNSWNSHGWPTLKGEKPNKIEYKGNAYHDLEKCLEAKAAFDLLPSKIPDDHPILYSADETSRRTKFTTSSLPAAVAKHFIEADSILVRIETSNGKLITSETGYKRVSVDAFVARVAACEIPNYAISLRSAAQTLAQLALRAMPNCPTGKKRKQIETAKRGTIAYMLGVYCRKGLLDAKREAYWTQPAFRNGWVIAIKSFRDIKEIARKVKWKMKRVAPQLRDLMAKRIADNGGKPPASELASWPSVQVPQPGNGLGLSSVNGKTAPTAAAPPVVDPGEGNMPTDRKKAGHRGRKINPNNLPKYKRCHELYAKVQSQEMKMRAAVKAILDQFEQDALGRFKPDVDANRKYRDQKKRLKDNAAIYRNSPHFS
jgi:hypothetical protein